MPEPKAWRELQVSPRLKWFSREAREKIVAEAISILERIGVFVENEEARSLLEGAGAKVDRFSGRVRIPEGLVRRTLRTVPRRVLVYDRRGIVAMDLGDDRLHFNPGSTALKIFDAALGDARTPVTKDLLDFARVVDALPNYAAQSTGLVPGDVPEEISDRYRLYIALIGCSKPVVTGTFRKDGFPPMFEMLCAVAGGVRELRERPIAIFDCCPSPPLKWSDLTCQALLDCARTGIPAELVSMPLAGATAPATLAGAVTQHCAENLSGIVIHQLGHGGSPIIWGGSPAWVDLRRGTPPMGAIETLILDGACAEIGKHLGLPTHAYMALSDAKPVDFQAGAETGMGAVIAALCGVNNVSGPGMLDFESCQSLEKLVLDHELCAMAQRLSSGIAIREDPIAIRALEEGISAGEFVSLEHTRKWYRVEAYYPDPVVDRATLAEWRGAGRKDSLARASEKVQKLLSEHRVAPLAAEVRGELDEIIRREAQKIGFAKLPELP